MLNEINTLTSEFIYRSSSLCFLSGRKYNYGFKFFSVQLQILFLQMQVNHATIFAEMNVYTRFIS